MNAASIEQHLVDRSHVQDLEFALLMPVYWNEPIAFGTLPNCYLFGFFAKHTKTNCFTSIV